jgi:hypothetical protein
VDSSRPTSAIEADTFFPVARLDRNASISSVPYVLGVVLSMEDYEPLDLLDVGLLRSQAVVFHTDSIQNPIDESRLVKHKVEGV